MLVLFVALPEPFYSGPDSVQLFSAASLEVCLQTNYSNTDCSKNKEIVLFIQIHSSTQCYILLAL